MLLINIFKINNNKKGSILTLISKISRKKLDNKSDTQIIQELDLEGEELNILYNFENYEIS